MSAVLPHSLMSMRGGGQEVNLHNAANKTGK